MADAPEHPRLSLRLEGIEPAAEALAAARGRGRLHHAWLLTGPQGIGKASFAYRAARTLLGAKPDPSYGPLGVSPDDPVFHLVAAETHPDLLVIERPVDKKAIPVEEVRKLPEFFAKAPAIADYRVAIIDAADDLNVNSANAVLKTLEEPPPRGVIFLVSHAPGGLIATIRSRCRRLAFAPWDDEAVAGFVRDRLNVPQAEAQGLARMAGGAPGRALELAATGALEIDAQAEKLLTGLPGADEAALVSIADKFRGGEGALRFGLLMERLAARVHDRTVSLALQAPDPALDTWAAAWNRLIALPREAEALNLDRADVFWSALADLRIAARARPFSA